MQGKLYVHNWEKFQHYKTRRPPWIKLHTDTFQNYEFAHLSDASKLLAIGLWTLASSCKSLQNPAISCDFDYIKSQLHLSDSVKPANLQELIDKGFILRYPQRNGASKKLATNKQKGVTETETEAEPIPPTPLSNKMLRDSDASIHSQSEKSQKPRRLKECPIPECRNPVPAGELYCSDLHKQWAENELKRGKA